MRGRVERVLAEAGRQRGRFERLVAGVPFERRGVLYSEILFVVAAAGPERPCQIVESGRARGQSTLLLALAFPDVPIRSVEVDPDSPDAAVAARRLEGFDNVELLSGDAREVLPRITQPGDVVVIDGPKGYRGLKLALGLLATARPAFVFVHDCHQGSQERAFLDRHVPNAFYSDHPDFEAAHRALDAACVSQPEERGYEGWRPHRFHGAEQPSYGPTFACLPHDPGIAYPAIHRRARLEGFLTQTRRSLRKRLGAPRRT